MDQLRRIGWYEIEYDDLEDEPEYNYQRKEDLKKDVKKLEEDSTYLRATNFRNPQVQMENKCKMEAEIKSLEIQIENLRGVVQKNENLELQIRVLQLH